MPIVFVVVGVWCTHIRCAANVLLPKGCTKIGQIRSLFKDLSRWAGIFSTYMVCMA